MKIRTKVITWVAVIILLLAAAETVCVRGIGPNQNAVVSILLLAAAVSAVIIGVQYASVSKILGEAASMLEQMEKGNFNYKFENKRSGEIGKICCAAEKFEGKFNALAADVKLLSDASADGNLDVSIQENKYSGNMLEMARNMNRLVESFNVPMKEAHEKLDKLSRGLLNQDILDKLEAGADIDKIMQENLELKYKGIYLEILNSISNTRKALYSMLAESQKIAEHALNGELKYRGDTSRANGGFANIIKGFNDTLDSIVIPINEISSVMEQMSNGTINITIEGDYKGDLNVFKSSVNDLIHTIKMVVGEIVYNITEIANKNLNLKRSRDYRKDWKPISDAFNAIIDSLNQVMGDINMAADQVSAGSSQVSAGSQALSQGATEQASSIEELTSAITEISEQTKQNASNATQASELAFHAKDEAVSGNKQMQQMQEAMVKINESSSSISKIVKVIDDISFQTNMLALNAAVEAARAGQYGKGFAVVAEEVRSLAARSAEAVKETTAMIEGITGKVAAGTKTADETANALSKIVGEVEKAAGLVSNIATASNEQATSIAQISASIEQVSQVVQTNSATAEESAASSEELSSQAELLKQTVNSFKLRENAEKISQLAPVKKEAAAALNLPETPGSRKQLSMLNDFGKY